MTEPSKFYDRLADQVAVVTGAGAPAEELSNGRAIALLFAAEGAKVVAVTRDPDNARRTVEMIERRGGVAVACAADVTQTSGCEKVIECCEANFGPLDILVNNVGRGFGGPKLSDLDDGDWLEAIDVNLGATFRMCRAAIPSLIRGSGKAIVNISSIAGQRAHGTPVYGPAKAALDAFTRELATIYGPDGIRANSVSPGHIFTPHIEHNPQVAPMREMRRKAGPLAIEGDAWDVAAATLFLASREARLLTGVQIPVDAGVSIVAGMTAHRMITAD